MSELIHCPHCMCTNLNGPHFQEYEGDVRSPSWWVECTNCPARMSVDGETPDALIAAWNRRAPLNVSCLNVGLGTSKIIAAPAICPSCRTRYTAPTTGQILDRCTVCPGTLVTEVSSS